MRVCNDTVLRYYGRNGWCDGLDVPPLVWDVTPALLLSSSERGAAASTGSAASASGSGDQPARSKARVQPRSELPASFELRYYSLSYDVGGTNPS